MNVWEVILKQYDEGFLLYKITSPFTSLPVDLQEATYLLAYPFTPELCLLYPGLHAVLLLCQGPIDITQIPKTKSAAMKPAR